MEFMLKGTPEEITKLLQAIGSSEEQDANTSISMGGHCVAGNILEKSLSTYNPIAGEGYLNTCRMGEVSEPTSY